LKHPEQMNIKQNLNVSVILGINACAKKFRWAKRYKFKPICSLPLKRKKIPIGWGSSSKISVCLSV
jgi:hypothetical protein